jgi:predicted transcriptional regulator YdeE
MGVQPSAGVTIRDFAGGLYAVKTLHNPFVDPFTYIPQGWKELHEWVIGSSQYRSGEHQWMEEIIPQAGGDDLKLYHPIVLAS